MTAEELIHAIEEAGIDVEQFAYGDFDSPEEVGPWEEVDKKGGEGEGDYWHSVKLFTLHNIMIKTVGFYSSYHGTDFHDGFGEEVKPVEKTIVVYE